MELHDEDEPPFIQHNQYRDSSKSETQYELGRVPDQPYVPEEQR
jgi:hypothetical protein